MENEKIGKITLDYTHYSGSDLYCDGDVEEELLETAKNCAESEYSKVIEEKANWPFLYHLSPIRENIIEWFPVKKGAKILEVGSGCGAITGALARKVSDGGRLDCVDLSRQRSLINAYRHELLENVTIHVGNFQDIEPDLDRDYDLICLIGVFEYGQAYIGGDNPYETFLNILKKHMAPDGQLVIAIENKFGLKYFAGCKEDHVGRYFESIEDYPGDSPARTFTENGLKKIAAKCGFSADKCHMYYPYPDYKFMNTLFSADRLPQMGELKDNLRNFDRDRMLLFDEKLAFENILKEEEFPLFSNSYLMVLGNKPEVSYARFSNDRELTKCIVTEKIGDKFVKRALSKEAGEHISQMADNYKLLSKRYDGSKLEICPCELSEDKMSVEFPTIPGRRLEELMDEKAFSGDTDGFGKLFNEFVERTGFGENESIADMDMIFSNIIVDGDKWTVIDYEWVTREKKYTREIAFRAMYCYLLENEKRNCLDAGELLTNIGVTAAEFNEFRENEIQFQQKVTNGHKSLAQMREIIGNEVISVGSLGKKKQGLSMGRLQVYVDNGKGFSEKESFYPERGEEGYEFAVDRQTKLLRLDPCNYPCILSILKLSLNDEDLDIESREFSANGQKVGSNVFVFGTDDPGFTINFKGSSIPDDSKLKVAFEINPLSDKIAADLPSVSAKTGFLQKIKGVVKKS